MSKELDFSSRTGPCDLFVITGEASGDEHAAQLIKDLLHLHPQLNISALGGERVESAGAKLLFPLAEHGVVGLWEVIRNYRFFRKLFEQTIEWVRKVRPRCILLVDYPGFNLRLARALKDRGISNKGGGRTIVLQYVSPQLWAWKPKRRFGMAATLDGLGVIFPFEKDCYEDVSLPVTFVGHPFSHPSYQSKLHYEKSGSLLLLPGSRLQPVSRILPSFLDAFEILIKQGRDLHGLLPVSDDSIRQQVENLVNERKEISPRIKIVTRNAELAGCAALMSSGTMSFSCTWAGIPGVIGYRAHPLTYLIGKVLVKVPYLGMANLLLSADPPNPEFLQGNANGLNLASEIAKILDDSESGKRAKESAANLHKMLAQPKERKLVDWLLQEGMLA